MSESELTRVSVLLTPERLKFLEAIIGEFGVKRSQAIDICLDAGLVSLGVVNRGHEFARKRGQGQPKKAVLKRPKPEFHAKPD